ncbi:MAG TPA: MopE-related protein [Polyangiaceae bacterium LLY-WYZ-14_1]|nr:MopE-related protein [Polyangiaceae bacterium LLY-WYZ-14_1]
MVRRARRLGLRSGWNGVIWLALLGFVTPGCARSARNTTEDVDASADAPGDREAGPGDGDDDAGPEDDGTDAGPDGGPASACGSDPDCDDGVFCNGVELCFVDEARCIPGRPPDCRDFLGCTTDVCDPELDRCVHLAPDDDEDGFEALTCGGLDCDDDRADIRPGVSEICDNGLDDDCNGALDCTDPVCVSAAVCADCDTIDAETDCGDGRDEDCDGLVDCDDDDDCGIDPACCTPRLETCQNGVDADCDGLELCDDPDCAFLSECSDAGA